MLLACVGAQAEPPPERASWVLIDTNALTLTVFDSRDRVTARFGNIAIGSGGGAEVHYRGDGTTPRGTYRVAWIHPASRFGIFYGLDYPTPSAATRAYLDGRLARAAFDAVLDAFRHGRTPPQDTALGGDLGIHGMGDGSAAIQRAVNWTDGCVALTNRQALELSRWVRVGTTVVIR